MLRQNGERRVENKRRSVSMAEENNIEKFSAHKKINELLKKRLISIRAPVLIRFCFLDYRNL
jgi:hypothetical protein